ncbi:MAG: hypothetical protein CVV28_05055 [Methanobacteriales archaeon HGW-Methanobacteriales-1]|jgi:hypothetical protein|nr:MAG: hypothetical protein CVV28_05055 [Methanobacteriales archaeon HGW-Methanobacteriales-1]
MKPNEPIFKRIDLSEYSEQERLEAFEYTAEYFIKNSKYRNTQPKDLLFNENEEINIDLWPSNKSTREELDSFKNIFREFGDTSGQISNEPRGISVETAIYFISGAIAAGFFGKCGSDAYDLLKGKLKDLLLKRGENAKLDDHEIDGYLNLKYDDTNTTFYYACFYSSEKEINNFLSNIHTIDSFMNKARELNFFPFNKGTGFDIHVEFGQKTNYDWDIRIRRYIQEGRSIVFNEFQKSLLKTKKLDELQWEDIKWEKVEIMTPEDIEELAIKKLKEIKEKRNTKIIL